ncbi:MAG: hypothetical protein FJX62_14215 [Alphaproteobacteria bacterium]|nr:hypothetical protein [Alphaproteobacteria bacterium]
MTDKTPHHTEGRILKFRPRGSLFARHVPRPPPVEDLGKFERAPDQPDDYRHRMKMNGLALAVTIVLVAAGIWIADTMAQMRKNQDCYLAGRPACTQVPPPTAQR